MKIAVLSDTHGLLRPEAAKVISECDAVIHGGDINSQKIIDVMHNKKELPSDLGDRQIIIFGHSHRYFEEKKDGRLWLNPGSCGKRRFDQDVTLAILRIERDACSVERIDIRHETPRRKVPAKVPVRFYVLC